MAYWSETRGLTLRLMGPSGTARFVRLTLVERRGLLGSWFNVREARAERTAEEKGLPSALGEGRLLSWRPQPKRDAEGLLTQRTRTLERIGYTVIHSSEAERAPWAWLQDLVHRQLKRNDDAGTSPAEAEAKLQREQIAEAIAVVDAQIEAKIADEPPEGEDEAAPEPVQEETAAQMLEGLARMVGLEAEAFREPDLGQLAQVDLDALAPLLDQLVENPRPELRKVAARWLELPALVYELDPAMIERWLEEGRAAARLIASKCCRHRTLHDAGHHRSARHITQAEAHGILLVTIDLEQRLLIREQFPCGKLG